MHIHFVELLVVDDGVEEAQQTPECVAILVWQHLADDGQGFDLIAGWQSVTLVEDLYELVGEDGLWQLAQPTFEQST